MTNIVTTIALTLGMALGNPPGSPGNGSLDIIDGNGLAYKHDKLTAYYDYDTKDLFGFQFIDRREETVEATFARYEKEVARFEKMLGSPFSRGVYKPWTTGLFKYDFATLSNDTGVVYLFCHYRPAEKIGMVQWGARRPWTAPKADPFGKTYEAQWSPAFNAEIDARIEKCRKADGVVPLQGQVAGRKVKIEQIESEFQFGCNIFNFDQLGDENQNAEYRAAFMKGGLFNAATVPFYWLNHEPVQGKPRFLAGPEENPDYWKNPDKTDNAWRRPATDPLVDFCDANGVSVHGHVLIYPGYQPKWVNAVTDMDARMELYRKHIFDIAAHYGRRIPQWDIVNESVDRTSSPDNPHDTLPWCRIPQPKDYTLKCFQAAAEAFPPEVKLSINDAYSGMTENGRYPAFTRKLLGQGARIDVIGQQMHIFKDADAVQVASGNRVFPNGSSWRPQDMITVLRQHDKLNRPIHLSEVTIPAPVTEMSVDEAEQLQARLIRDYYRLWFSWPSIYRISYWNAVDSVGGEILKSGFYRRDMTKKPAYHALWKLVNEEWRTKTEAVADANGVVRFRGFKGKYKLSWTDTNGVERVQFATLSDRNERFFSPAAQPPAEKGAVAVFRKTLPANGRRIARAELRVAPLGVFTAKVNGREIGADEFLKGGYTHFIREKHRFTYDVTPQVKPDGANEIELTVAGSWWCDKVTRRNNSPGTVPGVAGALVCTYADGLTETYPVDATWQGGWSKRNAFATIYDGEDFDASAGEPAMGAVRPNDEFVGNIVPRCGGVSVLRKDLAMKPVGVKFPFVLKAGEERVFDFGQNHAGVPAFEWQAAKGTKLVVKTAEMLNDSGDEKRGNDGPAGTLYRKNLRSARSEIHYTFGGDRATYRPTFTYFGYRYLSLKADADVTVYALEAIPATNVAAADEHGSLVTGDRRVNRFIQNCRWGMLSNFLSIPTDCPQRDERIGWAADTQVFTPAALYLSDLRPLLSKYTRDMAMSQMSKGGYPPISPMWNFEDGELDHFGSSEGWSDAGILIPYYLWLFQADRQTPVASWNEMERYMDHLELNKGHTWHRYGDWLSFDSNDDSVRKYISIAYWAKDARAMKEMAADLGKADRAAHYAKVEQEALAILKTLPRTVPSCAAHAVFAGLKVPKDELVPKTGRLTTGFLGASCILDSLTAMGGVKESYDLLLQRECPGWLYTVDQGGTTVWERWNSYTKATGFGDYNMNSFNHYAYGSVLRWLFRDAAGIAPDPKAPGFRHFFLAPHPDPRLGHLEAEHRSPYGLIRSAWKYTDGKCSYTFEVPPNTTATLTLPDGTTRDLQPGKYAF